MSFLKENYKSVQTIELGSITADGDVRGVYLPQKSKIHDVKIVDGTGIAADDSNYISASLKNGSTVVASYDSRGANQGAINANTPKSGAIVEGQEIQEAGSYLHASYDETGTVGMANAKLIVVYSPL